MTAIMVGTGKGAKAGIVIRGTPTVADIIRDKAFVAARDGLRAKGPPGRTTLPPALPRPVVPDGLRSDQTGELACGTDGEARIVPGGRLPTPSLRQVSRSGAPPNSKAGCCPTIGY